MGREWDPFFLRWLIVHVVRCNVGSNESGLVIVVVVVVVVNVCENATSMFNLLIPLLALIFSSFFVLIFHIIVFSSLESDTLAIE
jgi:hypothetical protein